MRISRVSRGFSAFGTTGTSVCLVSPLRLLLLTISWKTPVVASRSAGCSYTPGLQGERRMNRKKIERNLQLTSTRQLRQISPPQLQSRRCVRIKIAGGLPIPKKYILHIDGFIECWKFWHNLRSNLRGIRHCFGKIGLLSSQFYRKNNEIITRKHSNRMHTVRCSVCPRGCLPHLPPPRKQND